MDYLLPFKPGSIIAELGGGENPLYHPNIDIRQMPNVDIVADFNHPDPLPILNNSYDGIFCKYLLEHLSWRNVKTFLREIYRILRPGGITVFITADLLEQAKVLINTPQWNENLICMLFGGQRFKNDKDFDEQWDENAHHSGFSPNYITDILKDIGFNDIKILHIQTEVGPTDMIVEARKSQTIIKYDHKDNHPFNRSYFEGSIYTGTGYRDFPVHYNTIKMISDRKPQSVIDIGGARGYIAKKLNDIGIPATCIDISEHCYHTRATDNFVLHDITKIPYPFKDKEFDLAISISLLEHIPEDHIPSVLKEIARISKRGLHGITFHHNPNDIDYTHVTIRPKEWWEDKFKEHVHKSYPDYKYEILDKEDTEKGIVQIPLSDSLTKLNIGSFINMYHYSWQNIDNLDLSEFAKQNGYIFKQMDVTKGLPYNNNSVDIIISSHFIEHLDRKEGFNFLKECYRILKANSIIRLTIPDTELLVKKYLSNQIEEYKYVNIGVENSSDSSQSLFELLLSGHKTIYDFDGISKLLLEIGFVNIKRMEFNKSSSKEIETQTIDMYPSLSLYVEASKPENLKLENPKSKNISNIKQDIKGPVITKEPIEMIRSIETIKPIETIKSVNTKDDIKFKFSIIYMTYRPGSFDILLSSLLHQTYKNYELIIIDDYPGRSEILKPIFGYHKIPLRYFGPSKQKCYPDTIHGWSNAVNTGAMLSSGDVIIILQDYTYLPQDALKKWNIAFNETGLDTVICGGARMFTAPIPQNWREFFTVWNQPVNEDIIKLPGFGQKEDWIPERYEVAYTGIPRKIMEHLNGFDERFDDRPDGGETHEFFGRVDIAGYKVSVNRDLLCHMIDHRSWHPPDPNDDHLWYITRLEKFRNKPSIGIRWEDSIQAIKEGKKSLRAENCFDMEKRRLIDHSGSRPSNQFRPLKIALISTPFFTVPPIGYSGLEQIVWDLANALDELGHIVTIFGPEGSKSTTHGFVVHTGPSINTVDVNWLEEERKAYDKYKDIITSEKFDIVHGHNWFAFEYLLKTNDPKLKVIHTHHGGINWETPPPFPKTNLVTISLFMKEYSEYYFKQRNFSINFDYIYNGIDLERYKFDPSINKTNRLLYVGRFSRSKQPHITIDIAKRLNIPIDLIGGTFVDDINYLYDIESMCNDTNVVIHKNASHEFKIKKMQEAKALLFPSNMGEPFGLVACEAMACGTPVIALDDGAIKEVVIHGKTGFICKNIEEMIQAINNINTIDPKDCRKRAEELSRQKMAENYVNLYQKILDNNEW